MKIQIAYWKGKLSGLDYEHNQELEYSKQRLHSITDKCLSLGYSVQIRPINENTILVWIDNGRFTQS